MGTTTHTIYRRPRSDTKSTLSKLARKAKSGLISVSEASEALELSRRTAASKLARLTRSGWLRRVRRGLYLVLNLEAPADRPVSVEDPWVLAMELYAPCYIGGWSAAEYWGLTEQIFRSAHVVTAANVRHSDERILGQEFRLFRVGPDRIAGASLVWRGAERVPVSDRERTIIDCLRHPELCGGVRHLSEIMTTYRQSDEYSPNDLLVSARKWANGAAWKRLGFLAELLWPGERKVIEEASVHLTAGNAKLDPKISGRGKLLRRWRLWVNVFVDGLGPTM